MVRVLVAISSQFGANLVLAQWLEAVLLELGAQVRLRRVETEETRPALAAIECASADDLDWADGFVFSSPSHTGLLSATMKAFIDRNHDAAVKGRYLNKTFTGMATSGFEHAGQERVVDNLNAVAAAWGCLVVSPSTANAELNELNGNPFGLSFVLHHGKLPDAATTQHVLAIHFARFVAVTQAVAVLRAT